MSNGVLPPLEKTVFTDEDEWCFQQESQPTHKWLREDTIDYIKVDEWPSTSPDLNPLDYKLWLMLEECACKWRYQNFDSLKAVIVKTVREIPLAMIRESINNSPKCLRHCVQAKGSRFE